MAFVSYAQNFEDVMLWRALKSVGEGFYIDVGAAWPDQDSVTNAFYQRGWRGINIEPNPDFCARLAVQRPRDVNLQIAVSDSVGTQVFSIITDTGLSTLDQGVAQAHVQLGFQQQSGQVETDTLASVWEKYVPAGQPVHFLKVDVEGAERVVLCSNDWQTYRPWIVVVEATRPMSQVESHAEWESVLLDAGYVMAYFDGLNRFYVAGEQGSLCAAFRVPPNVFDDFVLARQEAAERLAAQAQALARESEARYLAVLSSRSWRMTAPLRRACGLLQRLRKGAA